MKVRGKAIVIEMKVSRRMCSEINFLLQMINDCEKKVLLIKLLLLATSD